VGVERRLGIGLPWILQNGFGNTEKQIVIHMIGATGKWQAYGQDEGHNDKEVAISGQRLSHELCSNGYLQTPPTEPIGRPSPSAGRNYFPEGILSPYGVP